jgi:hypothetical protein
MRSLHFVTGLLNVIAFLVSGLYMRFYVNPDSLSPGLHLLYVSRHIYMLGPALVHLVLSGYVQPKAGSRLQWPATILLILSSTLLASAFIFEAVKDHGRTELSAFGIYTFAAGSLLYAIAGRFAR